MGHTAPLTAVAFAPDGKTLATASYDNTARIWDVATGNQLRTLKGHALRVLAVAFSPGGKTLATVGWDWDSTARIWNAATGKQLRSLTGPAQEQVSGLAFAPDGKTFAATSSDNTLRIWVL
jgi:WD40 repeat protein